MFGSAQLSPRQMKPKYHRYHSFLWQLIGRFCFHSNTEHSSMNSWDVYDVDQVPPLEFHHTYLHLKKQGHGFFMGFLWWVFQGVSAKSDWLWTLPESKGKLFPRHGNGQKIHLLWKGAKNPGMMDLILPSWSIKLEAGGQCIIIIIIIIIIIMMVMVMKDLISCSTIQSTIIPAQTPGYPISPTMNPVLHDCNVHLFSPEFLP